MRSLYKIALFAGAAFGSAILLSGTAYADHESGDRVLGELVADAVHAVLVAAVSMLAACA